MLFAEEKTYLTFAGGETYLLFQQKFPLREFCAFEVLEDEAAWASFTEGFLRPTAEAAAEHELGLITDCFVWRGSRDYVAKLGYPQKDVERLNRIAVARMRAFAEQWRNRCPIVLAADIGPRGDGYASGKASVDEAYDYHVEQVRALAECKVDALVALTMTTANEAIGIVRAARETSVPILVSPTLETDGRLPDGTSLGDFVEAVDDASGGYPLMYLANCVHPTHIASTLRDARGEPWLQRFKGLRANASSKSHAELDNSTELDRGDVADLARHVAKLQKEHDLTVVGGCCGTDAEHLRAIANSVRSL